MDDKGIRINKYLGMAGICSRRASDRMIEDGKVKIDGRVAVLGDRVLPDSIVTFNGKKVSMDPEELILAFNKPVGLTCTSNQDDPTNIIDYINHPKRIYSIGRLDKDSEGLLLMTNNGDLADRIMRSRYGHEKEYLVTVDGTVDEGFLRNMSKGVLLDDGTITRDCETYYISKNEFGIILRQGLNRQIRRMCEQFDMNVLTLKRIRVLNIKLDDLRLGEIRSLTKDETDRLYAMLKMERQ